MSAVRFPLITGAIARRAIMLGRSEGNVVLAQIRAAIAAKFPGPKEGPRHALIDTQHVAPSSHGATSHDAISTDAGSLAGERSVGDSRRFVTGFLPNAEAGVGDSFEDAYLVKKATARCVSACENENASRCAPMQRANLPLHGGDTPRDGDAGRSSARALVATTFHPGADAAPAEVRATKAA